MTTCSTRGAGREPPPGDDRGSRLEGSGVLAQQTTAMTASAPAASARRASSMAWLVAFDIAPAMIRTRPRATSAAVRMTSPCSAGESVGASPAVSQTTMAGTPATTWCSQRAANALRSIASAASNGVGRSGMKPVASRLREGSTSDASPVCAGSGGAACAIAAGALAHVELDLAWRLDDGFGMMAVLEQCVFDGLDAADEQAAIDRLFLRDPLSAVVAADEDDGRGRDARGRLYAWK